MLDAHEARLSKIGSVKITRSGQIRIDGFDGDGCTCRDVAVLAMVHAIGLLQKELLATLQKPGGGDVCVD